ARVQCNWSLSHIPPKTSELPIGKIAAAHTRLFSIPRLPKAQTLSLPSCRRPDQAEWLRTCRRGPSWGFPAVRKLSAARVRITLLRHVVDPRLDGPPARPCRDTFWTEGRLTQLPI